MKSHTPQTRHLPILLAAMFAGKVFGSPILALQPETNYSRFVTEQQTVLLLIEQAKEALNSPQLPPPPGFEGKLPTNMETVAARLLEAAKLEPYRADLLFSAANACVFSRDLDKAIRLYEKILEIAPEDIDAHSYLAAWERYKGNEEAVKKHMAALRKLDAGRAQRLEDVFKVIDSVAAMPIRDTLPQEEANAFSGPVAIVVLGHVLYPDGSMNSILIQRLHKTIELAKQLPDALIVVTGGVPHNNKTEGRSMLTWLVDHGVEKSRIYEDNFARTTVENALFSRYALARHRIRNVVLASSGSHLRRSQALFTIACWDTGPRDIRFVSIGAPDKPLPELQKLSNTERLRIYRDSLKAMGLWSFRSYPLEER